MRLATVRLLSGLLLLAPTSAARAGDLDLRVSDFLTAPDGYLTYLVTLENQGVRDFCVLFWDWHDPPQAYLTSRYEVLDAAGSVQDSWVLHYPQELSLRVLRIKAGGRVLEQETWSSEPTRIAPGDPIRIRVTVKGFYCDAIERHGLSFPISDEQGDDSTGLPRGWPADESVSVISELSPVLLTPDPT